MRRRTVRIDGRVTSIQIEDAFWHLLKARAAAGGESLSTLLGRLRRQMPDGGNFASTLRLACLADAEIRAADGAAALARLGAAGAPADALALLALLPVPVLLLGPDRVVLGRSAGFLGWLGVPAAAVDGRPLDVLVARGAQPALEALWRRAQAGREPVSGVLNLVVAGRLRIARPRFAATAGGGAFVLF